MSEKPPEETNNKPEGIQLSSENLRNILSSHGWITEQCKHPEEHLQLLYQLHCVCKMYPTEAPDPTELIVSQDTEALAAALEPFRAKLEKLRFGL